MKDKREWLARGGLYGIADADFGDVVEQAMLLEFSGAACVQLRCKGWSRDRVAAAVGALDLSIPLIVNDHEGLGDGVHLGQDDGPFAPGGHLKGRSTHSLEQIDAAVAEGADYVGFGPIFETRTKANPLEPRGLEQLRRAVEHSPVPVVAIGGITLERLPFLVAAGARVWAPISAIFDAEDPVEVARGFAGSGR